MPTKTIVRGPRTTPVLNVATIQPGEMNWLDLHLELYALQRAMEGQGTLSMNIKPRTSDIIRLAERIFSRVRVWIDGYDERNAPMGYEAFRLHWKMLRNWVPLQFRLVVEQALYEKGEPWRGLVTGFGSIKA